MNREFCRGPGLSSRYLVPGTGSRYQVPATWHLVPDTRYRIRAEGRTPSTEDRDRGPIPGPRDLVPDYHPVTRHSLLVTPSLRYSVTSILHS